ncbi:Imidazolonepropionase (plasmid) [Rhodococcus ruber]|uniref:amidohydrolase family protein n=1 Tax=Rhodococcus ruber TaxID=1830 RepID=UPI00315D28BA
MFEAPSMLITNAHIFDGTGGEEIPHGAIWIEGDEIRRVGPIAEFDDIPDNLPRFDVGGRFVMPGLTESHTHLSYNNVLTFQDLDIKSGPETATINTLNNARKLLRCGFTSAYSFGSIFAIDVAVRDAINAGLAPGPRFVAAGRDVLGTSGEVDWNPDYMKLGMEGLALLADNPWEVRKAVRKIRKGGADNVKVYLDGDELTPHALPGELSYTQEEANAAVEEGRRHNLAMITHAKSAEAVKMAMKAGFDVIAHANFLDDEALDRLVAERHRVFVTPAANYFVSMYENGPGLGFPKSLIDGMYKEEFAETIVSVNKMRKAGIKVLPGGDFGFAWAPHGNYARDLQNFVELFGYTERETLVAATRDAGSMTNKDGMVGTLEAGKFADIIVVDGNPLDDITVLQDLDKITTVIKGGKIFHNSLPTGPQYDLDLVPGFTVAEFDSVTTR